MSVLSNGVEEQSKQRPELFGKVISAAKSELDPEGIMNPGVLVDPVR